MYRIRKEDIVLISSGITRRWKSPSRKLKGGRTMKFLKRAKNFLRWCIATPVHSGKSHQSLTDPEKQALLKMDSRATSIQNNGKTISEQNSSRNPSRPYVAQKYKANNSEHNK